MLGYWLQPVMHFRGQKQPSMGSALQTQDDYCRVGAGPTSMPS